MLVCLGAQAAGAAEKPLWEIGGGLTTLYFPDYRGSDQGHAYTLPIPYLIYRGKYVKADSKGVYSTFLHSDRVDLTISIGASLPVDSTENRARQGMPNLSPAIELGPSLDITLWRAPNERTKLDLSLPVRTVTTIGSNIHDIGWVATPYIHLQVNDVAGFIGWNYGMLTGPLFGSRSYHDYFYSVPNPYATAARPAYDAPGGYAGARMIISLTKRYPKSAIGAFLRWDTLQGAVFDNSPLVKQKSYFATGIAVVWVLGDSSTKVSVPN